MYLLYRLIKAFIYSEISINFFCYEFSLIYSRYEGLDDLEAKEFKISYSVELDKLYNHLNDLCSMYYEGISAEENKKYGYTTQDKIKDEVLKVFNIIIQSKLLSIPNDINL